MALSIPRRWKPGPHRSPRARRARACRGYRPRWALAVALALVAAIFSPGCESHEESLSLYRNAAHLWDAGQPYDAARTYLTLTEIHPDSPVVEDSLYWAATLYQYFLDDPRLAERQYRQLMVRFPQGVRYHVAMENLAEVYEANPGSRFKAILLYKKLYESEANADRRDYFLFKIAQVYLEMGKLDQTRFELRNLIREFPQSSLLPDSYYLIGYSYYREGRMPLAVVAFNQIGKEHPNHDLAARGRFFVADILEEGEQLRRALKVYESLRGKYHNAAILEKRIVALRARMRRSIR